MPAAIIIAGNGTLHCPDELKALAEKANIPVTSTLHAMGVFGRRHRYQEGQCDYS